MFLFIFQINRLDEVECEQQIEIQNKFIMSDEGQFCIEIEGHKSESTVYEGIARVTLPNGKQYIGVSDYYAPELKGIMEVTPVKFHR